MTKYRGRLAFSGLFMRCPSCGRRFFVRAVSRKLVGAERDAEQVVRDMVVAVRGTRDSRLVAPANATTVEEIPITRETFEVGYTCTRCHHTWTEVVTKVEKG